MIKSIAGKAANFIFHMLSISKCGYDNEYGDVARQFHKHEDVLKLEKLKSYITVNGGEHCGELYGICVTIPASFDELEDMVEYFNAIKDLFVNGATTSNFSNYFLIYQKSFGTWKIKIDEQGFNDFYTSCLPLKEQIIQIVNIYLINYKLYFDKFWLDTFNYISKICDELNCIFETNKYFELWEKELNVKYKYDDFYIILCNSIKNGPQAIDISFNKDIFAVPDNPLDFSKFVSHEFGIYLLKDILSETNAFKDFSHYEQVEGLAEFYNRRICGGCSQFDWCDEIIQKYSNIYEKNTDISPLNLFTAILS